MFAESVWVQAEAGQAVLRDVAAAQPLFAQGGGALDRLSDPLLLGGLAFLVALTVLGVMLVRAARGGGEPNKQDASTMLSTFREMHASGELSDAEYKAIRLNLGRKIQEQVDHTDDAG